MAKLEVPAAKRQKYRSKFQPDWEKEFVGIKSFPNDQLRAFCTYCRANFSVAYGGKNDVVRHVETPTHARSVESKRSGRQAKLF